MIISLSGGKDSTALALYLKDKVSKLVFCDTGLELPETYQYINKLAKHINKPLITIKNESFKYWLKQWGGYIPSAKSRWCTRTLKIIPFEKFLHENQNETVAVGLRADEEEREGNLGLYQANYVYPFKEDGLKQADINELLKDFGVPEFYKWKSRSGCYACPFLRKSEWIGLYNNYPELYAWAESCETEQFKWRSGYSLKDLREFEEGKKLQIKLPIEDFEIGCNMCFI